MAQKVLFIGGTGQISLPCVRRAVEAGHDISVYNRGQRGEPVPDGARLIAGDINDRESYARLGRQEWDVVAQFLARTTDLVERDIAIFSGRTRQYIFISSASVYAKTAFEPVITEDTPIGNPYWPYSQAKIASEAMIKAAADLPWTNVRPSHTVRTAIPTMMGEGDSVALRLLAGKPVIVAGDGTSLWTLMRSEDFAKPFVGLIGNPAAINEDLNITSDTGHSWDAIYLTIAKGLGIEAKIVHVPSDVLVRYHPDWTGPLFGDKTWTTLFDNAKVKRIAGDFRCETKLEAVLAEPIRFLKQRLDTNQAVDTQFDPLTDRIIADMARLAS
jgi:nucleoside-diphosphate-sugar epimerase